VRPRLAHDHAAVGTALARVVVAAMVIVPSTAVVPTIIVVAVTAALIVPVSSIACLAPSGRRVVAAALMGLAAMGRGFVATLLDAGRADTRRPHQGQESHRDDPIEASIHGAMLVSRV